MTYRVMELGVFNIINDNLQIIQLKKVISGEYVRKWCSLPYEGHPEGCPKVARCLDEPVWDVVSESPYHLVIRKFDLGEHARKMKEKFPDWTDKQCRNSRLWQSHQDKLLRDDAMSFAVSLPYDTILFERPEMNRVNLFSTCRAHNFILRKNPVDIVYRISMVGKKKPEVTLEEWFK